jgi:hypothetical protein
MGEKNPIKQRFGIEFFGKIPKTPGVYLFLDLNRRALYIGKAKCIRNRVMRYGLIQPGNSAPHLFRMISRVCFIEWLQCATEKEALMKENELLHAIRPPFNKAETSQLHYVWVGLKTTPGLVRIQLRMTRNLEIKKQGYVIYGCFKNRSVIQSGFSSLVRLLYAATFEGKRFHPPARSLGGASLRAYFVNMPLQWGVHLDQFLNGMSDRLLWIFFEKLLENESIPGFARKSIQEDLELLREFYEAGPRANYFLRINNKIEGELISMAMMDDLVKKTTSFKLK